MKMYILIADNRSGGFMYMFYMNIDNRLWGMRCKHLIYLNITNHTKKNIERILVHFQVKPKGLGKITGRI